MLRTYFLLSLLLNKNPTFCMSGRFWHLQESECILNSFNITPTSFSTTRPTTTKPQDSAAITTTKQPATTSTHTTSTEPSFQQIVTYRKTTRPVTAQVKGVGQKLTQPQITTTTTTETVQQPATTSNILHQPSLHFSRWLPIVKPQDQ